MFECLVIGKWYYVRRIRRYSFAGVGVAFGVDVALLGGGVFKVSKTQAKASVALSS